MSEPSLLTGLRIISDSSGGLPIYPSQRGDLRLQSDTMNDLG